MTKAVLPPKKLRENIVAERFGAVWVGNKWAGNVKKRSHHRADTKQMAKGLL
jgi:hypothetical protein